LKIKHEVKVTLRQNAISYVNQDLFNSMNTYYNLDVLDHKKLVNVILNFKPNVLINAVGIVKQRPNSNDVIPSLEINSLLPHRLAIICKQINSRLIHFSTDCVFSGKKGNYLESDKSDADDLYGKSKFLGEVNESDCLTIRSSIIGPELRHHGSLYDWFLNTSGTVKGYTNAIFTGFTTIEMGKIVDRLINDYPHASGLYHVSSDPINKYDLLMMIKKNLVKNVEIVPYDDFYCDRSLNSIRFRSEFNYLPPNWEIMIKELTNKI
jgi:dTDP-4-dehydrorhamnose reductase